MGRDHKDVIDPSEGWTFAYLYGIIHSISTRPPRSNYRCQAGEFAYFILSERIHLRGVCTRRTGQVGIEMLMCLVSETSQPEQTLRVATTIDTDA